MMGEHQVVSRHENYAVVYKQYDAGGTSYHAREVMQDSYQLVQYDSTGRVIYMSAAHKSIRHLTVHIKACQAYLPRFQHLIPWLIELVVEEGM